MYRLGDQEQLVCSPSTCQEVGNCQSLCTQGETLGSLAASAVLGVTGSRATLPCRLSTAGPQQGLDGSLCYQGTSSSPESQRNRSCRRIRAVTRLPTLAVAAWCRAACLLVEPHMLLAIALVEAGGSCSLRQELQGLEQCCLSRSQGRLYWELAVRQPAAAIDHYSEHLSNGGNPHQRQLQLLHRRPNSFHQQDLSSPHLRACLRV